MSPTARNFSFLITVFPFLVHFITHPPTHLPTHLPPKSIPTWRIVVLRTMYDTYELPRISVSDKGYSP